MTISRELQQEAAKELLKRRLARRSLLEFTRYTFAEFQENWHHRLICEAFDKVARGEIKRLMVFSPPRMGKSELLSRRFPAYYLGLYPDRKIIAAAFAADLAQQFNRDVQRIIDTPEYQVLFPETQLYGRAVRSTAEGAYLRNSDIFEIVGRRGAYRSAGVGGGIMGMGGHLLLLDDVIKDDEQANSPTYREKTWDWYRSTFYTRQEKDAAIVFTITRWHEDDLAGRILQLAEAESSADQWHVIRLPAIAEHPVADYDPRQVGEALWPDKFNTQQLKTVEVTSGSYRWGALYQQRPKAPEGFRIKSAWFADKFVNAAPVDCDRVRYWDKAGTEGAGAYTAGVLMARSADGRLFIEDVKRQQLSAFNREQLIKATAEADRAKYAGHEPRIFIEQEPGSGGKESAQATIRNLVGFSVYADPPEGNKDARLEPFAAQAEAGNVYLVRGEWNSAWLDEICSVPFGKYRDQSDATSGGLKHLANGAPNFEMDVF